MQQKPSLLQKVFSNVAALSLLLNTLLPFTSASSAYAQEVTPSPVGESVVSSPSPSVSPEITPSPTMGASILPDPTTEPTPIELASPSASEPPSPEPTADQTPLSTVALETPVPTSQTPETMQILQNTAVSVSGTISGWQKNADGSYTSESARQGVTYVYPANNKVGVTFTKLPSQSGSISIKEVKLTQEQVDQTGALSDTAYEITSGMVDGTFAYDLTLPRPPISTVNPLTIKFSETSTGLGSAQEVSQQKEFTLDTVTVKGLNHFTIFVIAGTISNPGPGSYVGSPFDETNATVVINEFVYHPSSGNEWVELVNKTNGDINLTGWKILDSANHQSTLSGTLPAKGLKVFDNLGTVSLNDTTNDGNGDTIYLKDGSSTVIDEVTYQKQSTATVVNGTDIGATSAGQSIGRTTDGGQVWQVFTTPTKGWFNGPPVPSLASIATTINSSGVTTNMATLDNPSAATGLYFEKTGSGKVTFSATLNLTNQNTTTFLQNLGTKMNASAGSMKFDAQTAADLKSAGAEIKLYGLDSLGYTVTPHLIVKDDSGNIIPPTDATNYPSLTISSYSGGTLTFTTNHFTQFDVDKDIYVNASNSSGNEDGSSAHPYNTIQEGVNAAPTNGIVHVVDGTYAENVSITNKSNVTLQASGNNANIHPSSGIGIAITSSSGATIKGFKITTSGTNAHGIWVAGTPNGGSAVSNLTIQDNSITVSDYSTGIYAEQSSTAHSGWLIGGSGHGNTIIMNPGSGTTGDGMDLYDVSASEVSSNTITLNSPTNSTNVLWTAELANLTNLKFLNNTVSGSSGSEIAILTDSQNLMPSNSITSVTVSGNTFGSWGSRALRVGTSNGTGTVSGITVSSNTFNMTADTAEVIGGTAAGSATGTGNTFNVTSPAKIQKAIDAARDGSGSNGDVIKVSAGTYSEDLSIPSTKTNLELSGTGSPTIKGVSTVVTANYPQAVPNIEILATGVKLHGFTIEGPNYSVSTYSSGMLIGASNVEIYSNAFKVPAYSDGNTAMSNGIQTWHKDNKPSVDISGLNIHDNTFTSLSAQNAGYEGIYLNLDTGTTVATIKNNTFTGSVFRAITTERSKTTISNNTITNDLAPSGSGYTGTGGWQGINIGGANAGAISNIIVSGNTIQGSASGKGFSYGVKLGYTTGSTFSTISVTNNNIHNSGTAGIWNKISAAGVLVNNNDLSNNTKDAKNDDAVVSLDVTKNWWGDASPVFANILLGLVNYDPWYTNLNRTTLSNNIATDATYTSSTAGQADLPSGVTNVALSNTTVLDVSGGLESASGDSIKVKGATQTLSGYVGGDLTGTTNLSLAQSVGGVSVTVNKAVNLQSGTDTQKITLTNSNLNNVSIEIPDNTTVLGTSGWDGKISPPKTGSSSGSAPSGFSVGSTVIEVGSSSGVLLFDQPVFVTLTGVTGNVGYKPAGSTTWTQITNACGGTYTNPTKPTFPGECYVTDNTNTKIYTYHFTTFGSLDTVSSSSSSGGGGGTGSTACTESNKPKSAPVLLSAKSNTNNEVTLTWSKALDPVTYYLVAYGLTSGSLQYGNPNVGDSNTTSFSVAGLSGGQTYYFRVRAGNNCLPGDYSNEIAVYVGGPVINGGTGNGFQENVLGTTAGDNTSENNGTTSENKVEAATSESENTTKPGIVGGLIDTLKNHKKAVAAILLLSFGGAGYYYLRKRD